MTSTVLGSGEFKLEKIISYLLIIGVIASISFEAIGIVLYYGTYGTLQVSQDQSMFITGQNFFAFIVERTQHLFGAQNALFFITLGLIILILTPYARAIASLLYFGWEKNRKYVLITLFVIIVLTISLTFN